MSDYISFDYVTTDEFAAHNYGYKVNILFKF